ncbi:amidohydrolase family protein [Alicyclobacillus sp. ALC3]|uniref:amidohydrolase family protein n=1 Tax=Alicyclobacillus sp. ALC3 TaxID=2796143 RepID=UPI002378FA56|nr:amidohydrolase family protein [Alicyclobacillus sp. ALC3]WDL98600.1 amidohydrolase family protein [Alicyclobacillus sp. ALC3]
MDTDFLQIPLIDHHCHAIVGPNRQADTEALLRVTSEAPHGYPVEDLLERAIWPAVLTYVSRYSGHVVASYEELGPVLQDVDYATYCKALFHDARFEQLFIDTGFAPAGAPSLGEIGRLTGAKTRPILRLESVAEAVFKESSSFSQWWESVQFKVGQARANGYVGAKSIAAYRSGLALHGVSYADAERAFAVWKSSDSARLEDERLLCFLVWECAPILAKQSLPLQFHTGYGDPDTDLRLGNPLHLRDFVETFTPQGLAVVLLHTYPYHREAGYMASVYDGVYFDTSLIVPLGLTSARRVVSEALELAPYSRFLFASDAHTRPELFAIAADLFKDALEHHLQDPMLSRFSGAGTRERWAQLVCHDNARKLYLETSP